MFPHSDTGHLWPTVETSWNKTIVKTFIAAQDIGSRNFGLGRRCVSQACSGHIAHGVNIGVGRLKVFIYVDGVVGFDIGFIQMIARCGWRSFSNTAV